MSSVPPPTLSPGALEAFEEILRLVRAPPGGVARYLQYSVTHTQFKAKYRPDFFFPFFFAECSPKMFSRPFPPPGHTRALAVHTYLGTYLST